MLLSLTIRDVLLIDRLDLAFGPGLTVLSGETGAGKSILLDSLGLALGARGESGLVRRGASQAVIAAEFAIGAGNPVRALLAEHGLEADDQLVLRRVLGADGRSRGFVNDQPAGIALMRQIGERMVEIQGQFEQRGLLDAATHRLLLDAFANDPAVVAEVRTAWTAFCAAHDTRAAAETALAAARAEEDFLRHAVAELDRLDPQPGEETVLAEQRALAMNRTQLVTSITEALDALGSERGAAAMIGNAIRLVERVQAKAAGTLDPAFAALDRAAVEAGEAAALLEAALRNLDIEEDADAIESRLFELRAMARKHGRAVDDLPALRQAFGAQLLAIEDGDAGLLGLAAAEQHARAAYRLAAARLSQARMAAAGRFEAAVMAELAPLKLDRARFLATLPPLAEADWGPHGMERVSFEVSTNPGSAPGPLARIASGGELSRLLLALKVVLARVSTVPTIVFDEVDSGIGGAVAAAVGERLQRLSTELQVLVVTHSPQVAARGRHHLRVAKDLAAGGASTRVDPLDPAERREEIARMLSGAAITDSARAAADALLAAG